MSRIGTFDIETSPIKGYVWTPWQQNVLPDRIIVPTQMLTWAWKWLDEPKSKMIYRDLDAPDFHVALYSLMEQSDLIIGYNHDKFDIRHVNREFVEQGMAPPRPRATVDLLKVVKRLFNFPHNSLAYVCEALLGESKLETGGFSLWPAFMRGDPKARKIMERYNKRDVILTEKLYKYLRPWISNHPYIGGRDVEFDDAFIPYRCPVCGSDETIRHRPRYTRCFAIRQVHCPCGSWFDGKRKKI